MLDAMTLRAVVGLACQFMEHEPTPELECAWCRKVATGLATTAGHICLQCAEPSLRLQYGRN
jgi:hypothetical protein